MQEDESYSILGTLRYDPQLTTITEDKEGTSTFLTVKSNWGSYHLPSDDNGYKFPDSFDLNDVRIKTELGDSTKVNFSGNKYAIIDITQYNSTKYDDIRHIRSILLERFLFYEQQIGRMIFTAKALGLRAIPSPQSIQELLLQGIVGHKGYNWDSRSNLITALKKNNSTYKMRILLDKEGVLQIQRTEIPTLPYSINYFYKNILGGVLESTEPTWDIFLDDYPIISSRFTTYKTTNRDHYDFARRVLQQKVSAYRTDDSMAKSEILLFNKDNIITEGSITNIAVNVTDENGTKYVTPFLTSGCLCGTMRYYLLKKGYIEEGVIQKSSINVGDSILLFNGVMGCVKGIVRG
ncbi:similar to Saccharomyces cerevisiae YMR289W ABZ2 Aminodeoxychorismate lyase (4- amino-4-deoxychorismate lyase), catalyzes the third step in para-aminobenzoic acid biosynthesis [Maudiozyma barnettii]|uniref:Similar to Saccharomyces cerevisiae YMR289W ABZ2 Aminodeoxychorismate lyase (4- amino-4-deoxychorismate lyase), catalyzes the third step in para-aminobenzoic acid biosynthesis n=1 Tax=Maudiozyma barnettii TaxID=61262 RepID=A0A8H2VIX2_9SACH|nr:aminodeoxychorismate lyase ABZ2 [Kazachstania barnettii]CAB4256210.1 similar to Saccharomyces cerevisiae YMR289W ABZ2 Aminodeoxychorismate lyase (4- amino-4-deoxychorismate lyase), catalyzes the third step in para-aminobenzoic acid biosynthesis [Kazachstania barnettii]CAD1784818.1 similar to Saccharomyces cerevisiae YMR289W ABZ2 Aminodeoxychorismate lyase (4- amino-4-deoxychorismate lyase), catalyzes the third step in para-aminobenzoic acid biosynthesis [Kazachstania barnettii]